MDIADALRARASKYEGVPTLEPFIRIMGRALGVHEGVHAHHAIVAKDSKLTALGRQAAMRQHVAEKVAPRLLQCRESVEVLSTKLTAWRAKLQPPKPDAATSALRAEARGILRAERSNGARVAYLLGENANPLMRDAALEAPDVMSGINAQIRDEILTDYIERNHGGELRQIELAEQALEVASVAVSVAGTTVRAACEFPHDSVLADFVTSALGKEKAANITIGCQQEFGGALVT